MIHAQTIDLIDVQSKHTSRKYQFDSDKQLKINKREIARERERDQKKRHNVCIN